MGRKRRSDERSDGSPSGLDRVLELLETTDAAGMHDVAPPAAQLPSGLPEPLIDFYARCDGARLFLDSVELVPSAEVAARGDHWVFGSLEGEELLIDERGRIWRSDESLDDLICEGTRLDRWLAGLVDALAVLYDHDGEFADNVFDEEGELLPEIGERQLRAQLKRDPQAPGPRWRLAHLLLMQNSVDDARKALEEAASHAPGFPWAWLDLAKISERLGDRGNAIEEARAAADAAGDEHPQAGYFQAQLARLALLAGDEATRAVAAKRAAQLAPALKDAQLEGARSSLADGDLVSARGLLDLLRAVWPRDLAVLDLARQVDAADN